MMENRTGRRGRGGAGEGIADSGGEAEEVGKGGEDGERERENKLCTTL